MRRLLLLTAATLAAPMVAYAQEAVLPDQVVTATRIPTLAENIPAGVTIIDRATIEARGYVTLVDALSAVPGLHVVQSGGQGGNASVFIRGTNSDQVLVLRDGMPVNDPSDPNDAYNFGVDTLGDVERIEVVRGPMSGLYGTGAIGGVINIITKRGSGAPTGTAVFSGGTQDTIRGRAAASGSSGQFDYSLAAESGSTKGFDTTPQRESVYTGSQNGYRSDLGSMELGYTPIAGTRFSAYLRGRQSVFGLDELGSPAYDANDYTGRDAAVYGRVGVTSQLFDGIWQTTLMFGRVQTDRSYIEPLETLDPNQAQGNSSYHGRRNDVQWNNTIHLPDAGPATASALTVGYEHIDDHANSSVNTTTDGFPYMSTVDANASSDAGHAGLQTLLFKRLTYTADVRGEDATYGGSAVTWRTGGVLAVPEVWSRLKASVGTAFRAPSLFELFGVDSYGYMGNPDLKPERSTGYELGWAVDIPALGRSDAATIDVTYFHNDIRDLIEAEFEPVDTTVNIARARTQGVETSVTVRPASWLQAVASYTYTDSRDLSDNSLLLRRPLNAASLDVRATPLPGLTIAPELVYSGSFQDYLVNDAGFQTGVGQARSGLIFNMTTTYDITPQVAVFAEARNIGDSRFEPASGFQIPGPSVLFGTRLRF